MGLTKNNIFLIIFLVTTIIFSVIGYNPADIVIGGPNFPQLDYFSEELDIISEELGIKIQYLSLIHISEPTRPY